MGLCASSQAADNTEQHVAPQPKPQAAKQTDTTTKPAATPAVAPASKPQTSQPNSARTAANGNADDDEYRSQLKSIFLHLLDRLLQVMEHERESATALATLRKASSDASYLTLFGSDNIEAFLRSTFDVDSVPRAAASASPLEREQAFAVLVQAASQRVDAPLPAGQQTLNRRDFTERIKSVTNAIQVELKASQAVLDANPDKLQRAGDLRKSLVFFQRTFNFTQGDIANDAKLLEANIDAIIADSQ